MKKSLKTRLTLNRETLRNLSADQMSEAQGGIALQANHDRLPVAPHQLQLSRREPDLSHALRSVVLLRRLIPAAGMAFLR